jgi:glycosyltransferase involved in cell wall biosynthesis
MKICFICGEYPPGLHGGIGTMTQILGRSLAKHGHEVRVIGVYAADYMAPDFEEDQGVKVWRLRESKYRGGWIAPRYRLYRQIASWANAGDIDVIEVPDYQGWAAYWRKLPVPVIGRLHGSLTYFAKELGKPVDTILYWLERASLQRLDYLCSVCEYTSKKTQQAFKLTRASDAILYNPVELQQDSPAIPRSQNYVVFSGTLTEKKGILSLMKAWPLVVKSRPDAQLHIFGKNGRADDGQSMLRLLSAQLNGGRQTVRFHGHVSREELFKVYQTASVAVFPSYAEAFAIGPLEAMAYGCATIYSRRGSGVELMEHEREGLLIDPDQPEEIAGAILRVLSNADFASRIGNGGRARIREQFSIDGLISQNVDFYHKCVSEFRARRILH